MCGSQLIIPTGYDMNKGTDGRNGRIHDYNTGRT